MVPPLTCDALTRMAVLRNQGSTGPNIGSILAAEIVYIAIVPFAVVEAALKMIALHFFCLCGAIVVLFLDDPDYSRWDLAREIGVFYIEVLSSATMPLVWAVATVVMNVLPVRLLENEVQANRFFRCQVVHLEGDA